MYLDLCLFSPGRSSVVQCVYECGGKEAQHVRHGLYCFGVVGWLAEPVSGAPGNKLELLLITAVHGFHTKHGACVCKLKSTMRSFTTQQFQWRRYGSIYKERC